MIKAIVVIVIMIIIHQAFRSLQKRATVTILH